MSKDTKKEKNENFIKGLKVELKKVTWPTGKELVTSTATVIFLTILLAAIVFVLDFGFEKVNTLGITKIQSAISANKEETTPEVVEGNPEGETSTTEENSENSENTENAENVENTENTENTENNQEQPVENPAQ